MHIPCTIRIFMYMNMQHSHGHATSQAEGKLNSKLLKLHFILDVISHPACGVCW